MGHQDNCLGYSLEIAFQPHDHILVQMIGRLIQKIQVCFADQRDCKCDPLFLTAGEHIDLFLMVGDAELIQYGSDLVYFRFFRYI